MQLVIEEEEYVYNMKLPSSVPHHTFHLYPVAYFHNLLPFDIYLSVEVKCPHMSLHECYCMQNAQGMKESHTIGKGQKVTLSCFSLEDTRTTFHYKIVSEALCNVELDMMNWSLLSIWPGQVNTIHYTF